jgi:hypothetical protein
MDKQLEAVATSVGGYTTSKRIEAAAATTVAVLKGE